MEAQRKSEEIMEEPNHKRFRKGWRFECSGDVGGLGEWLAEKLFTSAWGGSPIRMEESEIRIRIIQLKIGCSVPVSSG